ncbi:hypothetical protein V4C29_23985 [Bacillus cereus]|jgi:hypothetical protein|uniref:hypothetical protein n=1 Tax=Bacillus cereus TaxID=1396 RepID=UPI002FE4A961|nr:hypothetical protein [Bacillus cereus]
MKQLTLEDVVGSFDYTATSTAERFLAKPSDITVYEVHFYDQDEKQKIDWFEEKNATDAEESAKGRYGKIQIIKTVISKWSLAEIMELD